MMQFRITPGDGLLIGPDCVRVFIQNVHFLNGVYVVDLGVHAPPFVAVNRDRIPRSVHLQKQEALAIRPVDGNVLKEES